jgi:hypothetical protein
MKAAIEQSIRDEHNRIERAREAQPEKKAVDVALKRSAEEYKERAKVIAEMRSKVDTIVRKEWETKVRWDGPWIRKDGPCQFDSLAYQLYICDGGSDANWTSDMREKRSNDIRKRYSGFSPLRLSCIRNPYTSTSRAL